MTVKELKEAINKFSDDTRIFIPGMEGGYNDLSVVREAQIVQDVYHKNTFMGQHENLKIVVPSDVENGFHPIVDGIIFTGFNNLGE